MGMGQSDQEMRRAQLVASQICRSSRPLAVAVTAKIIVEEFQFSMAPIAILPVIDLDGRRLTQVSRRAGMSKQALFPLYQRTRSGWFSGARI